MSNICSLAFVELFSSASAEKLRNQLHLKKVSASHTSPTPNPFRTMPKETPNRQTSPPPRGGYSTPYNDRGRGGFSRGGPRPPRGAGTSAYQTGYSYRGGR